MMLVRSELDKRRRKKSTEQKFCVVILTSNGLMLIILRTQNKHYSLSFLFAPGFSGSAYLNDFPLSDSLLSELSPV